MNTSNETSVNLTLLDCPVFDDNVQKFVEGFTFWVEGVSQTIIAILGIFGNVVAAFILTRKEMRNAFNLLLVTLACFDSTYLFGSILESFRKEFSLATTTHIILFPYLLYPFNQIAITGSIFMTVAIALERFIAVHYPIDYSQAMHEANALSKRICKYVSAVIILSVAFTITRFFEASVVYDHLVDPVTNGSLGFKPHLEPTEMRTAPLYTMYFNWSRLIVLGIIPFVMLVYLNAKIYKDIQARRKRHFTVRNATSHVEIVKKPCKKDKKQRFLSKVRMQVNGENASIVEARNNGNDIELRSIQAEESNVPLVVSPKRGSSARSPVGNPTGGGTPAPPALTNNEQRRKKEDNMAVIFMGFILVFLICHFPRLLLNIHELVTIQHAMACQTAGFNAFPYWSLIMISISHILLVVNSSTNIFIYCFLSSKFRQECAKLYQAFCNKVCCK